MKVLFAVSNEEISESIVKKYQKSYKQIISYKNVYYFNAILKELQKDKTYDRIVISEDLEAFTHTQYDQIDKFIFEKLDSISDEASNVMGNDTPIILICSDRRTKSEQMLVKLFGIGVYNAIIGNDRSVDEVCRLINRPRTKKEAKTYYKIDSEEVNYQAENENDVSEMEIQNILAHYKRLGKNEDRYVDSFNNIAAQYNDTQLRIISKFLPLNVRAILEERSPKYQQIMSFNNKVSNELRIKNDKKEDEGPSQILLKTNNRETTMSKPVVIPSAVNMNGIKKLSKPKVATQHVEVEPDETMQPSIRPQPTDTRVDTIQSQPINEVQNIIQSQIKNDTIGNGEKNISEELQENQEVVQPVKRGRGRPRKNVVSEVQDTSTTTVKRGRGRPKKIQVSEQKNEETEETVILPGFEDNNVMNAYNQFENEEISILPGFENEDEEQNNEEENILPGFEDNNTANSYKQPEDEEISMLPGFEDEYGEQSDEEENILPGFEDNNDITQQNNIEQIVSRTQEPKQVQNSYNVNNYNNGNVSSYEYNAYSNIYNNLNNNIEDNSDYESMMDLSSLLTPDKKIITFLGTSKNGTSFIVNNLAELMSSMGVNTAILDTTQNRNSYYIYTKNEEQLRATAARSIEGLTEGITKGINVNKNLTVYTALPDENEAIKNVDKVLETLVKNYSLILIDTDFNTPKGYFKQSQETYLVQTMDILTIQPLTAFLRELKAKNILDEKKLRIVLNKFVKIRGIKEETIIGGMAFYNDPAMAFMTELFDRDKIKYVSIPFEEETYIKYLEGVIQCEISLKGYSKVFLQTLKALANMVYPVIGSAKGNTNYMPPSAGGSNFTPNMNNTLDKMKRNF